MLKIAIIGAGPAGLSFYHHLTKHFPSHHALNITVFDSHSPAPTDPVRQSGIPSLGGGYGLAANGMASLKRMGGEEYREVFDAGFPTAGMVGMSARGHHLGFVKWWVEGREGVECCVMVLRERVLDALKRGIPEGVVKVKKVVDVRDGEEGAVVVFEGGEEEGFDLVVGADGVWSKARRAVIGVEESVDAPVYKKLFTVAGFVETRIIAEAEEEQGTSEAKCQTFMTFGPNGMFGCTPYETGEAVTKEHIRGEKRLQAGKMAFWWARSEQEDSKANPDNDVLHSELLSKVKTWNAPIIHKVVENSKVVLKIPTFVLKTLPTWHSRRVVLLGDAAHAMPSSTGQGVSQSFEDAEALALLLAHQSDGICSQDRQEQLTGLQTVFGQYEKVRKVHVEKIVEAGNRAGDQSREMSRWQEWVMYGILKIVFGFFGSSLSKPALEYDVVREVEKVKDAS